MKTKSSPATAAETLQQATLKLAKARRIADTETKLAQAAKHRFKGAKKNWKLARKSAKRAAKEVKTAEKKLATLKKQFKRAKTRTHDKQKVKPKAPKSPRSHKRTGKLSSSKTIGAPVTPALTGSAPASTGDTPAA